MVKNLDSPNREMYTLAAGGFKDFTRIASSSPDMWQQICLANKDAILKIINIYQKQLSDIHQALLTNKEEDIYTLFEQSRDYRNSFQNKNRGSISKIYHLSVYISDEIGQIAAIATFLSQHEISIKNIGINNNREDYEGVLEIVFENQKNLDLGKELLLTHNYEIVE